MKRLIPDLLRSDVERPGHEGAGRSRRRLAAVWFADIVGYTRLMSTDEAAALTLVRRFQALVREQVTRHGGRVVKFIGDAAFAEFPSADAAGRSAHALREAFREATDEESGRLRIGIHVGDIVTEADGDLYGDGVNTASRLQSAADPDEILISESVWRHVRQQSGFTLEDRGRKELPGMETPERVWAIAAAPTEPASATLASARADHSGSGIMGVGIAYLAGAWILLQVVDTLNSLYGLPHALVRGALVLLVIGFPIVVATAWVQLRRSGGLAPLGMSTVLTWRNATIGAVAALALWAAGAAVWIATEDTGEVAVVEDDGIRVLAVLPFDNLLPDPGEQEWLVAGLHEQVIHEIQRLDVPDLRVISRTSVLPFGDSDLPVSEIADRLNADALLEGSVRRDGDRLRATLQLIDAETDHHVWSHEYDASLGKSFLDAQSSIALRVARSFTARSSAELREPTGDPTVEPEALRAYLQGRHLWRTFGGAAGQRARGRFQQALEIDPDFALAWAALAEVWLATAHHFNIPPNQTFPRADSAAIQALASDPDLAEAHAALADSRFHYDWNWTGAERGFLKAIELNPSHATAFWWYAGLLAALDRTEEAAEQLAVARAIDPANTLIFGFGSRVFYWGGRYDEALDQARLALELAPTHPYALGALGFALLAGGEVEAAIDAFERSVAVTPKFLPGLAFALARAGREPEARAAMQRTEAIADESYFAPYERAIGYVGIGDHERALDLLEESVRMRDAELIWVAVEPAFDPLRDDPRFRAILRTMRFPQVEDEVAGPDDARGGAIAAVSTPPHSVPGERPRAFAF